MFMKTEYNDLCNVPVIMLTFEEKELQPVRDEIAKIQRSFESATTVNHHLVGNIEQEYKLTESIDTIQQLLAPCIDHEKNQNWTLHSHDVNSGSSRLTLDEVWVNFMKKHEFNPIHNHTGVWSFVIWMEVPYDIEDERSVVMSKNSKCPSSGYFSFMYANGMGSIQTEEIPVDKTFRNRAVLFPSKLHHCVYPFSSTDDYRISVSGNFKFKSIETYED